MADLRLASLFLVCLFILIARVTGGEQQPGDFANSNPVATALAFVHQHGKPDAIAAGKDRQLKIRLSFVLHRVPGLPWEAVSEFFDKTEFDKFATNGKAILLSTMDRAVRDGMPQSRKDMHPKLRLHADLLSTQFDTIEDAHRAPAEELVAWIVKNYQSGKPLGVIAICTGNTRRSMLGATMGNVAAAYHGLPDVRFYSGGTETYAFNPRTIAALKDIGVVIEPTGAEARRGELGDPNPIYRVEWGKGHEIREFSKKYFDEHNPQKDFAAVLVCSEADTACPKVNGASARISVPYLDPKAFDGAAFESGKYAERRDDVGRFMLSVMMQAHRRLKIEGKIK